ncbi:hypothetical protein Tco_0291632 [Tanacetum coccineum]
MGLISPRWSVTTAIKGDTLQGSAGLQGTKKIGIGRTQEGLSVETYYSNACVFLDGSGYDGMIQAEEVIVENSEVKASETKPKAVRKNNGAPIIKDWVSNNEEDDVPQHKIKKKTFKPIVLKIA